MKLLVSVRDQKEAKIVCESGVVDLLDLKEPSRGSLGAVSQKVAREIGEYVNQQRLDQNTTGTTPTPLPLPRLSLAFGELADPGHQELFDSNTLRHFDYAKIGLSHCGSTPGWQDRWLEWAERVAKFAAPVAVAYADPMQCQAPPIEQVARLAIQANVPYFLIDTWQKDGRHLFDHLNVQQLNDLVAPLRDRQIQIALAGTLTADERQSILAVTPDVVAVRGAVCSRGDREQSIDEKKISEFFNCFADNKRASTC